MYHAAMRLDSITLYAKPRTDRYVLLYLCVTQWLYSVYAYEAVKYGTISLRVFNEVCFGKVGPNVFPDVVTELLRHRHTC